jgi:threonine dehydratase
VTADLLAALLDRVPAAVDAVRPHVLRTPVLPLARPDGSAAVQVKCEHLQRTGSFKVRGAIAKLSAIGAEDRERGVVAASSGNHGLGVAFALQALGGRGLVCVPENASPVKVAAIRRLGVEVRHLGEESGQTETLTRDYAEEHGLVYVSPYNDLDVVSGQATVGVELAEQAADEGLDAVVVAVGGGGLVSGVAAAVRAVHPGVRVIGASPANDAVMVASVAAGHVVSVPTRPTVSDGTAGGIEPGALTLGLCRELVDEWLLVEERDIAEAMRLMIDTHHQLVEGAAGVALAAGLQVAGRTGQRVAVVSCGANIATDTLMSALGGSFA